MRRIAVVIVVIVVAVVVVVVAAVVVVFVLAAETACSPDAPVLREVAVIFRQKQSSRQVLPSAAPIPPGRTPPPHLIVLYPIVTETPLSCCDVTI